MPLNQLLVDCHAQVGEGLPVPVERPRTSGGVDEGPAHDAVGVEEEAAPQRPSPLVVEDPEGCGSRAVRPEVRQQVEREALLLAPRPQRVHRV